MFHHISDHGSTLRSVEHVLLRVVLEWRAQYSIAKLMINNNSTMSELIWYIVWVM